MCARFNEKCFPGIHGPQLAVLCGKVVEHLKNGGLQLDSSIPRTSGCSSKEPEFESQSQQDGSHGLRISDSLLRLHLFMVHRYTYRQSTQMHKIKIKGKNLEMDGTLLKEVYRGMGGSGF